MLRQDSQHPVYCIKSLIPVYCIKSKIPVYFIQSITSRWELRASDDASPRASCIILLGVFCLQESSFMTYAVLIADVMVHTHRLCVCRCVWFFFLFFVCVCVCAIMSTFIPQCFKQILSHIAVVRTTSPSCFVSLSMATYCGNEPLKVSKTTMVDLFFFSFFLWRGG